MVLSWCSKFDCLELGSAVLNQMSIYSREWKNHFKFQRTWAEQHQLQQQQHLPHPWLGPTILLRHVSCSFFSFRLQFWFEFSFLFFFLLAQTTAQKWKNGNSLGLKIKYVFLELLLFLNKLFSRWQFFRELWSIKKQKKDQLQNIFSLKYHGDVKSELKGILSWPGLATKNTKSWNFWAARRPVL